MNAYQKGVSTSFGGNKPLYNLSSIMNDMDTSDMYEGGRHKRKRGNGDSDYDSDSEDSRRKRDPDAYDHDLAKFRTKLIRFLRSKSVD